MIRPEVHVPQSSSSDPPSAPGVVRSVSVVPPVAAVGLVGEIDVLTVDQLRDALACADAADVDQVVIDVRSVTFLDVGAFSVLLLAAERLAGRGATMHVRGARPFHRRVLSILSASPAMVVEAADVE